MKRKINTFVKNLPLSRKLVLLFGSFLLSVFCVFLLVVMVLVSVYEKRLYEDSLRDLDYFVQTVRTEYDSVEEASYNMALNRRNQELMAQLSNMAYPSVEYTQKIRSLRALLQDSLYQEVYITGAYYLGVHEDDYAIEGAVSGFTEEKKKEICRMADQAEGGFVFVSPDDTCPYLIGARAVRNRLDMSMQNMGYVILFCDMEKTISDAAKKLETRPLEWAVVHDGSVIFEEGDGRGIPVMDKLQGEQGYQVFHYDGEQYFTTYLTSRLSGWTYVQTFLYSQMYGTIRLLRIFMLVLTIFAFSVLFLAANRLSRYITEPIEVLIQRMKLAENGDLKLVYEMETEERKDEVGKLSQEFHYLLGRIQELVYENYERQLILQDTKYKMLQAQINPHFLYNTLNTVNWMVQLGHDKDAGRVVVQLGKLLRASFDRNPYASAREELEMLKNYIAIQEYRYRDRVTFFVEEKGALEEFTVPRMMLQPLVENALNYGADRMQGPCTIRVEAEASDQYLSVGIHDNGPGVDAEKLEAMRSFTVQPEGHGIGLKNIHERLEICYEHYDFSMNSSPGEGMHIMLRLPRKTKDLQHGINLEKDGRNTGKGAGI